MIVIKNKELIKWSINKAKKMSVGEQISGYTMKEDRGFHLVKTNDGYLLEEFGFENHTQSYQDLNTLKKALKKLQKIEFYRSQNAKVKNSKRESI